MTEPSPDLPKGRPPNRDQLAERLGERMAWWDEVRETVLEIGATWKWAYSDATASWNYRSYLPGDRFFVALSLTDGGFEVSLNLKTEEWEALSAESPAEATLLESVKAKAAASGDDPAWVHVPVQNRTALALLAKMLVIRAKRVQKPRLKRQKKR